MKAVIANDHGGVEIARRIADYLEKRGIETNWLGVREGESADYPDMAYKACTVFIAGGYDFGVLCCGTGIGISIAANKIDGIRCALPQNEYACAMAKEHNRANFIAFGGRIDYPCSVECMLDAYIDTKPSDDERHIRRIEKIMALEKKNG